VASLLGAALRRNNKQCTSTQLLFTPNPTFDEATIVTKSITKSIASSQSLQWKLNKPLIRRFSSPHQQDEEDGLFTKLDATWDYHYKELERYKRDNGHCNVPTPTKLGRWASTQRWWAKKKDGPRLSDYRRKKLDEIGFSWDARQHTWEHMFKQLVAYHKEHGTFVVPREYDQSLADWVHLQRRQYARLKRKKKSHMTIPRKTKLDRIGFFWKPYEAIWETRYHELRQFRKEYGHCYVDPMFENQKLAKWVVTQRHEYNMRQEHKSSRMTDERIAKLNKLKFEWDGRYKKTRWSDRYEQLKTFHEKNGHCRVPRNSEEYQALYDWAVQQRGRRRPEAPSKLSQDQISKLDEISFEWGKRRKSFGERYEELKKFQEKHGHCEPPRKEYPSLATWVSAQRKLANKSQLNQERVDMLDKLGFAWKATVRGSQNAHKWERRCAQYKKFIEENGHDRVPLRGETEQLYHWTSKFRRDYKKFLAGQPSLVTEERAAQLDKTGAEWTQAGWMKNFNLLKEHLEIHGDLTIPKGTPLFRFVRNQRKEYRRFKCGIATLMTEEKIAKLNEVGFDFEYDPDP